MIFRFRSIDFSGECFKQTIYVPMASVQSAIFLTAALKTHNINKTDFKVIVKYLLQQFAPVAEGGLHSYLTDLFHN